MLGFAHTLWQQSDGLFDLTAGILRRAWDFKSGHLPAQSAIDPLLPLIGWQRVQWDASSIRLPAGRHGNRLRRLREGVCL